jgi:hypothetical protein
MSAMRCATQSGQGGSPAIKLHGEGSRQDANQHPHIEGSGRKQEPSHPALLRNLK